ncbi:MAG: AIR synthase-related protein, partial [Atribacterota bacterium]|nr:AIR synthase-related protein [Atribacterota bacterium]
RKGIPPFLDLQIEKKVQSACRRLISKGLLTSAHDCAIGGLAIALAESCITGGKGATIDINTDFRPDCLLFGESQSRIIVSAKPEKVQEIINIAQEEKIPFQQIGMVGGDSLKINKLINIPLTKLEKIWNKQDETR